MKIFDRLIYEPDRIRHGREIFPSATSSRQQAVQNHHGVPALNKFFNNVAADETGTTGHKTFHRGGAGAPLRPAK